MWRRIQPRALGWPAVRRLLLLSVIVPAAFAAGCGSSSSDKTTSAPPTARPADFPSAAGKTLDSLRAGLPGGVVLAPSTPTSLEARQDNRLGFALFTEDQRQIQN